MDEPESRRAVGIFRQEANGINRAVGGTHRRGSGFFAFCACRRGRGCSRRGTRGRGTGGRLAQGHVGKEAVAAAPVRGVAGTGLVAFAGVDLVALVGGVVGAPALGAGDEGIGIVIRAEVVAQAVRLVDGGICLSAWMRRDETRRETRDETRETRDARRETRRRLT